MAIIDRMTVTQQPDFIATAVRSARRFYLDLKPRAGTELTVACGGCEHCTADYGISRPGFRFHCVEYVARGRGTLVLAGRRHDLQPGVAFAYGPGIAHTIASDATDPLVKYFVDFTGRRAAKLLAAGALKAGGVVRVARPDEALGLFDALVEDGLRETTQARQLCAVWLELLLLKLSAAALPHGAAETPAFETYRRCRALMEEHAIALQSTRELARRCHVDPAYLCRLFSRFGEAPPYQVLQRLKMRRAAALLQEPGAMVKKVSAELHFPDPYHFSRAFKRIYGMSPLNFAQLGRR